MEQTIFCRLRWRIKKSRLYWHTMVEEHPYWEIVLIGSFINDTACFWHVYVYPQERSWKAALQMKSAFINYTQLAPPINLCVSTSSAPQTWRLHPWLLYLGTFREERGVKREGTIWFGAVPSVSAGSRGSASGKELECHGLSSGKRLHQAACCTPPARTSVGAEITRLHL